MRIRYASASLLCVAAAALAACAPASPPTHAPADGVRGAWVGSAGAGLAARLDSIVNAAVADDAVPGLSVAVSRGGEVVFARGFGLASTATGDSVGVETIFRSGSVTKQFTAAAIMRLAEQGRLSLDDEITRWLPDFPTQGHRVTVRHLLNHTSGIRSYTEMGLPWIARVREDLTPEQMVAIFRGQPFDFAPGEQFRYNNSGYFLLGMIIERASGRTYAEFVEQEFARPLGLSGTFYCPNEPAAGHAHGYRPSSGRAIPSMAMSMTHPYAAGALCTTAVDLVRWKHALTSGRVVSADSYRRMVTPDRLPGGQALTYGFGLGLGRMDGVEMVSHTGGIFGFTSILSHFPAHDVSIAVLANSEGANPSAIATRLARAVLDIPEPEVRDITLTAAARARYVGTYDLGPLRIRIFEQDGRLVSQATGQPVFGLLAQGNHEFRAAFDHTVRLVFEMRGERAESLTLYQGGAVMPAPRVDG
jgi:D-alanyl-D-alanine carboxypeptidase